MIKKKTEERGSREKPLFRQLKRKKEKKSEKKERRKAERKSRRKRSNLFFFGILISSKKAKERN